MIGFAFGPAPLRAYDIDKMQAASHRYGARAESGVLELQALIAEIASVDEPARLVAINRFFNRRIVFRTDWQVWGVEDYWASPLEMMGKGAGDCEDYAIGKYFSLLVTGIPVERMRLVYVRAVVAGVSQAHMVLAYYARPDDEPLILDNLIADVMPASRRPDLTPVFSFNSDGLWQGDKPAGNPVARLSQWREVMGKVAAEGFLSPSAVTSP